MYKIGDSVVFDGEEYTIKDIAYKTDQGVIATANTGELHYELNFYKGDFWVPSIAVSNPSHEFFDEDARSPHLIDLGYSMVAWLDGLEDRPDNSKLPAVATLLMAIQWDKEGHYGSSWKGKGEYRGIMSNIDRKYDRLDNLTDMEIEGSMKSLADLEHSLEFNEVDESEIPENKIDAIADLTNYGLLYMTYVKDNYPRVFNVWVKKNVPQYLRDKIPFI